MNRSTIASIIVVVMIGLWLIVGIKPSRTESKVKTDNSFSRNESATKKTNNSKSALSNKIASNDIPKRKLGMIWKIRDIELELPTGWQPEPSSNEAWLGLVRIPTGDDSPEDIILTAHFFDSGFPDSKNAIDQWCIDFSEGDGGTHRVSENMAISTLAKATVTDVVGTYHPRSFSDTIIPTPKANWRLCVAVLHLPSGPLYLRMIGPKDAVRFERENLIRMIKSVH